MAEDSLGVPPPLPPPAPQPAPLSIDIGPEVPDVEESFDPFAGGGVGPGADPTIDPFQTREPFEDPRPRRVNLPPDGVTLKINPPREPKQSKTPTPKTSPLDFLANAKEGRIKIRRMGSPTINSQGYYKRDDGSKVKVGIGECGFIPVCSPEELSDYIKDLWGGGRYELTHVDQDDKKIAVGMLDLPQIPKPIEGVVEEEDDDNEFDDAPVGIQPGAEDYPERDLRQRPYIPGLPPGFRNRRGPMSSIGMTAGLAGMDMDGYRPRPPVVNTWRPSEEAQEAKKELEVIKQRLDEERRAREMAEKERVKASHESDLKLLQLKVEEATKAVASTKSQEATVLKAELDGLKRELAQAMQQASQPKTDPMLAMFEMMRIQQAEAAKKWEQEKEEQRRRDDQLREERERRRDEELKKENDRREEIRRLEEQRREEDRRKEMERREEIRRLEEARREEERERREEQRRLEEARKEEERERREEQRRQRDEEIRREESRREVEREALRIRLEAEREARDEARRLQEQREARELEERRQERERAERREEERRREQQEFMRLMFDQHKAATQSQNPMSTIRDALTLAQEIQGIGPEEKPESTAATVINAAIPALAAIGSGIMAARQEAAAPPVAPVPQGPPVAPPLPGPRPHHAPSPPPQPKPQPPTPQQQEQMVDQYAKMLQVVVDFHKDGKNPVETAQAVTAKANEIGARKLLELLKKQTLDSLQKFIGMARLGNLVGGMNAVTLDAFEAVIKTPDGSQWADEVIKAL